MDDYPRLSEIERRLRRLEARMDTAEEDVRTIKRGGFGPQAKTVPYKTPRPRNIYMPRSAGS